MYLHMYTYVCTCIYIDGGGSHFRNALFGRGFQPPPRKLCMHVCIWMCICMCVCMNVWMYVCAYVYVCMNMYIYIDAGGSHFRNALFGRGFQPPPRNLRVYECIYVLTCVYMHVHTWVWPQPSWMPTCQQLRLNLHMLSLGIWLKGSFPNNAQRKTTCTLAQAS